MCWGKKRWGVRRLMTHIENLPPESAFVRSRRDVDGWDQDTYLLAASLDEVAKLRYYVGRFLVGDQDVPERVPRPGTQRHQPPPHPDTDPPTATTPADLVAFLERG